MPIMIFACLPLYTFWAWRFVAAWRSYQEGTKRPKNSPLSYLLSTAMTYTIVSPVIIFWLRSESLFVLAVPGMMFCLGLWHFYFWYKFKKFENRLAAKKKEMIDFHVTSEKVIENSPIWMPL